MQISTTENFPLGTFRGESILNVSSCKRVSNFRKCASQDKVFRTLLSATKDSVFGICELFVKSSTKNFIFISTTRLRAVGELSPASSWKKDALKKSILFLFLILPQNISALHFRPEPGNHQSPVLPDGLRICPISLA